MKLPRNSKLLRSPFDAAPFAAVLFLLVILLLVGVLLPTPGVPLQLPPANQLPGTDQPTVFMAVDRTGRYFFANQMITNGESELFQSLSHAVAGRTNPPTLVINADQSVTYAQLVRITLLARDAGITNALLATLPGDHAKTAPKR
jgi:biopolymer transport protein ExbD